MMEKMMKKEERKKIINIIEKQPLVFNNKLMHKYI
jgi:hypothetical protein